MSAIGAAPSPAGLVHGTAWGASTVRKALSRFETLLALALGVSVLALVETYLTNMDLIPTTLPSLTTPVSEWATRAWAFGVQAGVGLAIAVLVIAAIVVAISGLIAWRRGVLAMAASSAEYGPSQVEAAGRARADHATTLWLFLAWVLVGVVVVAIVASVNYGLDRSGRSLIPDWVGSVANGLATSSVLVAIYYYGGRHLSGLLFAISAPSGRRELARGRNWLVGGALVGVVAALSPLSFWFGVAAVASLALLLTGAHSLHRGYELWLAGERAAGAAPGRLPSPS